ncbi:MAG: hypothetical protein ABIQ95_07410 [Bdellovibrionia bacterium]
MHKFFILVCLLGTTSVHAEIRVVSKISAAHGIKEWSSNIGDTGTHEQPYTECAELEELDHTFLCASYEQVDMNRAMIRASIFVEGDFGVAKGEVIKSDSPIIEAGLIRVGGHDLTSVDLMQFYTSAIKKCETDSSFCLNELEKEFYRDFFLPELAKRSQFVVITFAVNSRMSWDTVVSHELQHANYFLRPLYRETVNQFWEQQVADSDKNEIRNILSVTYDVTNDFLLKNEFQAYLVQSNPEESWLAPWVKEYRGPLMEALSRVEYNPVQIEL